MTSEGPPGGRRVVPGAEGREDHPPLAMDPETMRRLGYRAVDAMVERLRALGDDVPWRGGDRTELEPLFRGSAPEGPSDPFRVLDRAVGEILPLAGRVDHPRFFAFVPSSPTWPSVLGAGLAAGFSVFQGTWLESAGPSQVELVVLDWIREWVGYPEGAGGLFTSGGSAANLDAVVTAREAAGNPERPVVYRSDQGHSSLDRAVRIAGIPRDALRVVPSDDAFRMRPEALADALRRDREAGRTPVCVCANGGATNTGAVDPLPELAAICREAGVWLHVDAAYGGFAVLDPRGREVLRGLEEADSITLDPHKWLFQPYETGCLLVRDVERLEAAFRILPEYLQDTEMGRRNVNFADRGLQLTRSFRALRVWMSIQTFGVDAFRRAVGRGIDLAAEAGRFVEAAPELELLAPPSLGVVCFRFRPPPGSDGEPAEPDEEELEALNRTLQDTLVSAGEVMMSSTRLRGRYALRLCILNRGSRRADVIRVLERIRELGRELAA